VPVDLVAHNATVLAADARAESPVGKSPTFVHCKRNQLETIVCHFQIRIPDSMLSQANTPACLETATTPGTKSWILELCDDEANGGRL